MTYCSLRSSIGRVTSCESLRNGSPTLQTRRLVDLLQVLQSRALLLDETLRSSLEMATEFLNAVRFRPWFFLYCRVRPSVSVFFLGWRVRMSVIRTAKIPKIGKIDAKIRASVC